MENCLSCFDKQRQLGTTRKVKISAFAAFIVCLTNVFSASAQQDLEDMTLEERNAYQSASLALRDGPLNPASLAPVIESRTGLPRIEYQSIGPFGGMTAAMTIVFAQDENCLLELYKAYKDEEDVPTRYQACRYSWAAEIVRASVPDDESRWSDKWFNPRERWNYAVGNLASLILQYPDQSADQLIDRLPLEHISITPVSCPIASPNFAGVNEIKWMPQRFLNVIAPDDQDGEVGILDTDGEKVSISLHVLSDSVSAKGKPKDGTPMLWGLELMQAFQPCIEAAGYGQLGWSIYSDE